MSTKNLSDLLDSMLDDSALERAAEEVRHAEELERQRQEAALRAKREEPAATPTLDDIAQLTGLIEADLRQVLGAAAPDDLLVVLATADDTLQRRILRNMSEESVGWLRENLVHMDHVSDHERDQARAKVLKAANKLLAAGEIGLPEAEAVGAATPPDPERKKLRELLVDLVTIANQSTPAALTELAESAGEPLLRQGLARIVDGAEPDELKKELATLRGELERRYARRLEWMGEALIAIRDGESAEAFDARVFREE